MEEIMMTFNMVRTYGCYGYYGQQQGYWCCNCSALTTK